MADQFALHPKGSNFALWSKNADWVLGEEFCLRGDGRNVQVGMVGSVQHLVRVTDGKGSLFVLVEQDSTAGFGTSMDSTSLKVVSTLVLASSGVVEKGSLGQVGVGVRLMSTRMSDCKPSHDHNSQLSEPGEMHGRRQGRKERTRCLFASACLRCGRWFSILDSKGGLYISLPLIQRMPFPEEVVLSISVLHDHGDWSSSSSATLLRLTL